MSTATGNLGTPDEARQTPGGGASDKTHQQWVVTTINSLHATVNENTGSLDIMRLAIEAHGAAFLKLSDCVNNIEQLLSKGAPSSENAHPSKEPFDATMSSMETEKSSISRPTEDSVSNFTKDELNAKLAQNKAEVESVAAGMRTEMANFRTAYVESFSELSKTLNRIESRADATEKRLTQAQWVISLVISICAVTLSAVIFFSNKNVAKPVSQPSVVVNTSQPNAQPQNDKPSGQ